MTHDSTNLTFTVEHDDDFDPLEDAERAEDEPRADEFLATVSAAEDALAQSDAQASADADDQRPAAQRIAELFDHMAPRRTVLLGILASCVDPQPVASVNERVDQLQSNNFSVYSAANLCALLEKAGALQRVASDGGPAASVAAEPQTVVVDGVEYLEAREPVAVCWMTTQAGREALESDKPLERLHALLDEDAAYAPIYKRILTMCAHDGGAATVALNAAVDNDPLVQKPRFYAPHFVDRLEKCDALAWRKAWCITDVGQTGLALLADVVDPAETADEAVSASAASAPSTPNEEN